MRGFKKKISKEITDYFENKIKDVNWRDDTDFKDEIQGIIDYLDELVDDAITIAAVQIDNRIEEWEADYLPTRTEEMLADMDFRENELEERSRCM